MTAQRSTWARSPAWAPAFIATAPPTVPGMLAPHSRPSSPFAAARCTARGSEAPPPHQTSSPRTEMLVSRPVRRSTKPRNPSSETIRLEPRPTTATGTRASRAHASAPTTPANEATRARWSAVPPTRIVVSGASGASVAMSGRWRFGAIRAGIS